MTMHANVIKAHIAVLENYATSYETDGREGASEVAFLLRRAAKIAGKVAGLTTDPIPPLPTPEAPVEELRA